MLHNVTRSLRSASMVIALLVLAVAMAAGTVALSVVDTVVLRPLPFDKSEDLAALVASPSSTTLWQPVSELSRSLLKFSGGSIDDYATFSTFPARPSC